MSTFSQREAALVADLEILPDYQERLAWLMQRRSPALELPENLRHADQLVRGCVSQVWLAAEGCAEAVTFRTASDSQLVGALVRVYAELASGLSKEEIRTFKPTIFEKTNIHANLSPTRQGGLEAVWSCIQTLAGSYAS